MGGVSEVGFTFTGAVPTTTAPVWDCGLLYQVAVMVMLVPQAAPEVATPVFETIEITCGAADVQTTDVVISLLSGGWM